jgi:peroxiredoxin
MIQGAGMQVRSGMIRFVHSYRICMSIQPGSAIPDIELQLVDGDIRTQSTGALFAGRKVVLFGLPGAFTPTCSNRHLPGYTAHFPEFRRQNIEVMCLAVNDGFVMQAWAASQQVPSGLLMLADGNGDFTRALGLELDGSAFGMGLRTRRFALYAVNGVVQLVQVEAPGELRVSTAEAMLTAIAEKSALP